MGGHARWSAQIVICLQDRPKGMIPFSASLLNIQLPAFSEQLPARHLRSRAGVICHRLGMRHAHVLAHHSKPCAKELSTHVAAYQGWDIKQCQPMADHCLHHGLRLQPHSVLVPLVLLLGTATMNPLWRLTAKITQSQTSPCTVTSGVAMTSIEIDLMKLLGMAVYTGFPAVDRLGCAVARHTARAL